jgi:hypothetical protein
MKPPLARDLFADSFADIVGRHPAARPLIAELRLAVERDEPVEQALEVVPVARRAWPSSSLGG